MKTAILLVLLAGLIVAGENPMAPDQTLTILMQRAGVPDSVITYALKLPRQPLLNPGTYLPEGSFDYLHLEYDERGNPMVAVIQKYVSQKKNVWQIECQPLFDLTKGQKK